MGRAAGDDMRRVAAIATGILALALATPFGLAWYASEQILRSSWYEHRTPEQGLRPGDWSDPEHDHGLLYQEVSFAAIDGSRLRGWFVPGPERPRGTKQRPVAPHAQRAAWFP